ncbi:hypothetical protein BZA77DRAFT_304325 [Pyronema omphalodes]|nr:hypothetical protein BZA77DRAFT_304325 [Pyronema omphalodes]
MPATKKRTPVKPNSSKKRQTKLNFAPQTTRTTRQSTANASQKTQASSLAELETNNADEETSDSDTVVVKTSSPRTSRSKIKVVINTPRKPVAVAPLHETDEEDDDDEPVTTSVRRRGKKQVKPEDDTTIKSQKNELVSSQTVADHSDADGDALITPLRRKRVRKVNLVSSDDEDEEEDEDEEAVVTPGRRLVKRSRGVSKAGKAVGKNTDSDSDAGEASDSDSDDVITPARKRRRNNARPAAVAADTSDTEPHRRSGSSPESDSDSDSDSDIVITPGPKRRILKPKKSGGAADALDAADSDLELLPPPSGGNPDDASTTDEEDLESDTELAKNTPVLESRTRGPRKKNPRQTALAKLLKDRSRKAGLSSPGGNCSDGSSEFSNSDDDDDDDERNKKIHIIPSDSDLSSDANTAEDKDRNNENNLLSDSSETYPTGDLDADIPDFIVDDSDGSFLGSPADVEIPLEFTSASHASNRTQFLIYASYLLRHLLFPMLTTKDTRARNAEHRLNQLVIGLNNSVIISGAWRPEFTRALKERPNKEIRHFFITTGHCDACNRNNQHCKHSLQFTGRRYDPDTLEDLSDTEDEEEVDRNGEELAPESKVWVLGSSCYRRAKEAHTLAHWKKELREWVKAEMVRRKVVTEDGENNIENLEEMEDEEKERVGLNIAKELEVELDSLYDDFRNTIKAAEEAMVSFFHLRPERILGLDSLMNCG